MQKMIMRVMSVLSCGETIPKTMLLKLSRWSLLCVVTCNMSGCIQQSRFMADEALFTPLAQKKLSDFDQGLAHLKLLGAKGDAMSLAIEWLHASLCVPLEKSHQYDNPLWEALSLGLDLEKKTTDSLLLTPLYSLSETQLKAKKLRTSEWAFWPQNKGDEEGWSDELPTWLNLYSSCPPKESAKKRRQYMLAQLWPVSLLFTDQNKNKATKQKDSEEDPFVVQELIQTIQGFDLEALYHLLKLQKMSALIELASVKEPSPQIQEWQWWLKREQAKYLAQFSQVELGWPPLLDKMTWLQSHLYSHSCVLWNDLYQQDLLTFVASSVNPPKAFLDLAQAQAQVALFTGLCYLAKSENDLALKAWAKAVSLVRDQSDSKTLALTRYHQLRLLLTLGRYEEATQLRSVLPSTSSPLYTPFVYALGEAMSYAGKEDALMNLCTQVFRDRSWRKDPFLRSLFYLFVRSLSRFDFEARVLELLEDLGPRTELYERVFIFAHVALDEGFEETGLAATRWLLGHHEAAQWRPRYHGLEARAAILRLDQQALIKAFQAISPADGSIVEAIQEGRRGEFFETQDQALVELLRLEIPKVAGWPSQNRKERRLRVKWLDLIAQEMQIFLRKRPETRSRKELISLYRSIRQNLPINQVRAYSEQVGRTQRSSVLIGYVRVNGVDLSRLEPRSLSFPLVPSPALTLLPQSNLTPSSWPLRWPKVEQNQANNAQ